MVLVTIVGMGRPLQYPTIMNLFISRINSHGLTVGTITIWCPQKVGAEDLRFKSWQLCCSLLFGEMMDVTTRSPSNKAPQLTVPVITLHCLPAAEVRVFHWPQCCPAHWGSLAGTSWGRRTVHLVVLYNWLDNTWKPGWSFFEGTILLYTIHLRHLYAMHG